MATSIKVVPAEFAQAKSDILSIKTMLDDHLSLLKNAYTSFSGSSKGKTAQAFSAYYHRFLLSYSGLTESIIGLEEDIAMAEKTIVLLDEAQAKVLEAQ